MKRQSFLSTLILLQLILTALLPAARANELALGRSAKKTDLLMIPNVGLAKFNGISNEQLYKARSDAVYKYKSLLFDTYEPSDMIFGMCESKKPWWGVWGMHLHRQGMRSIEGPSKESAYILNPFRLVSAEANNVGLWNAKEVSKEDLANPEFPFLWESGPVFFNASRKAAQVWYLVSKYNESLIKYRSKMRVPIAAVTGFSLICYNARDFGYRYIYMDPRKSFGIKRWPAQAVQIRQFLHCGGSCGYPGGCNNMSPHIVELDENKLTQLPARAHLKLWKEEPDTVSQDPDFTFIIDFK